ncbi:MAG: lactonase family protein [Cytophagales bacterium]|nr:lactonase family protein [Cytophagales bacterium]
MKKLYSLFLFIALVACSTQKETETNGEEQMTMLPILVGTYTAGISEGVYQVNFNPEDGSFGEAYLMAKTENPSYLAVSKIKKNVYVVNENENGTLSTFEWNSQGSLNLVATRSVEGKHPCHVSVNGDNSMISVANYSSGNVAVFQSVAELVEGGSFHQHEGKGTHWRQDAPHAHFSTFSKDGKYLYAVDLGIDEVKVYDIVNGNISGARTAFKTDAEDGPRHLDFHPGQDLVYVLNELSNTVTACEILDDGTFKPLNKVSALPEGYEGDTKAADIHVSAEGKYLYYSNRGFHSISVFSLDGNGGMDLIGHATEGITNPRSFTLSPDGKFLIVANQDTDNIISFKVGADGLLTSTGHEVKVGTPVCVKFY